MNDTTNRRRVFEKKYQADRPGLINRLVKEIVHETGQILGLEHCPNPECVMHFSNTLAHTDRKKRTLCSKCANRLRSVHG